MKRFLLLTLLLSQSVFADLDQAITYAEAGDVRKGQIELYNISQRALDGHPKSMCEMGTMYKKEGYWMPLTAKEVAVLYKDDVSLDEIENIMRTRNFLINEKVPVQ